MKCLHDHAPCAKVSSGYDAILAGFHRVTAVEPLLGITRSTLFLLKQTNQALDAEEVKAVPKIAEIP
jgi:hypothetical protein